MIKVTANTAGQAIEIIKTFENTEADIHIVIVSTTVMKMELNTDEVVESLKKILIQI